MVTEVASADGQTPRLPMLLAFLSANEEEQHRLLLSVWRMPVGMLNAIRNNLDRTNLEKEKEGNLILQALPLPASAGC